jgi:phospholipid/cholesterol/gamma-HCH transport system substrate-binding protein
MKNTLETRLGIFVALAVIAAVLIMETVGGVERFRRGYRLFADFNNVQELKKGDRVKMAGVEVGRVEDIGLEETNNKVRVTLKLRRKVTVRTDSTATIKFTGLLGQNFVALDFGSQNSPKARDGAVLTSVEQPDLSAIMQKMDNVASGVENITKSFTGDKIDNLLGPITDFLKANQNSLTTTFSNMASVSSQVASGRGTVGKLIYDDALYNAAYTSVSNLQNTAGDIKVALSDARGLIGDARSVMDQVKSGQGTMGKLLTDDALYRETLASVTNLREMTDKMNHGQGSVGKLINDQEFYNNAKLTLQKLDKATEGLEDQGPLSVLGLVVNKLF